MGGVAYWRVSDLRDGVMRTVMSRRVEVPEISAVEAQEVNRMIPSFDNKISRVYQVPTGSQSPQLGRPPLPPFGEATDWMRAVTPCG